MSRRHSSSRRRNYGRRQHEVRERRPGLTDDSNRTNSDRLEDWQIVDVEVDDQEITNAADAPGGHAR